MPNKTEINHTELIAWAKEALSSNGYGLKSTEEIIFETPWSSVIRFSTDQNCFYLKQTPPDLFIEAEIISTIRNQCQFTEIPGVIEVNKSMHCFLMRACGDVTLRTHFSGKLQTDLLIKGIQVYRSFQKATAGHLNAFIQLGVPDWQLNKFPNLYRDLIRDENFLTQQGINYDQIERLNNLQTAVSMTCEKIGSFGLPESLNHSDCHDNNLLLDQKIKKIAIIDLGETAIDHPFFSLAAFLKTISNRYQLKPQDKNYLKIKEACFTGWFESNEDLQEILILIEMLLPVYLIFTETRLINATCPDALSSVPRMQGRIKKGIDWFIKSAEKRT